MRIVTGRRIEEIDRDAFRAWANEHGDRLHVDLGTGDGRYAYELAGREPDRAVLGLDPDRDALAEYSAKARRKPARGGRPNVRYALAAVEDLPPELDGLVTSLSIILPWGSLLRTVALPEPSALATIRAICAPGTSIELVLTYDHDLDPGEVARLDLPPLGDGLLERLAPAYTAAGFALDDAEHLSNEDLRSIPSTWAKRLGHGGRQRAAWRLRGRS